MDLKEIAKVGLKGRKKDTLLLKIVITLAFIFIVTSTIFQGSIETTKRVQRLDLYGGWHAAYMQGDDEVLDRLKAEKDIDNIGVSTIIGESKQAGVVGTFNKELMDMGRFKLYAGRYPEAPDEIMVELNKMSDMGLELEVGQKISIAIDIVERNHDLSQYIQGLEEQREKDWAQFKEMVEKGLYSYHDFQGYKNHFHHAVPFENVGNVLAVVTQDYVHVVPVGSPISPEMMVNDGVLYYHKLTLKRDFIITGIINTYTDKWDSEGFVSANAFITEESGQEFLNAIYENSLDDFSYHEVRHNIYLESHRLKEDLYSSLADAYPNLEVEDMEGDYQLYKVFDFMYESYFKADGGLGNEDIKIIRQPQVDPHGEGDIEALGQDSKMEINTSNFRRNNFSYPDMSGSTEHVLTFTIVAIIFVATALAIFQIFLTQMRRRARKIVLLKSIGATNSQIVKIIYYEGLCLLRSGLVLGVPSGFALAALLVYGMNYFAGRDIQFHIVPNLLLLGIVAGCLALFVGMAVPVLYAIRIPLVGTMSKPPKHKKRKKSRDKNSIKRQTFASINFEYYKQNRGKTLISFGLSLMTIIILITTVLLCYITFDNYREVVLANNRPDYAMESFYGENKIKFQEIEEELLSLEGIKRAENYKVGRSTILYYDGMEDNQLINRFSELLPGDLRTRHFIKYPNTILGEEIEGFYTKYYGVDPDSDLFDRYNSRITLGKLDKKRFTKGEEVILLVPMYSKIGKETEEVNYSRENLQASTIDDNRMSWLLRNSGSYNLSYMERYANYYQKPDDIRPGDTIYLSADEEKVVNEQRVISFLTKEVRVGGIIHYFPNQGEWPFSNRVTPYIVIGSYEGMEALYPNSRLGLFNKSLEEMKLMTDTLFPNKYGRTIWYLKTDSYSVDYVLDARLLTYANEHGYTLYNYKASNAELYHEALNNAVIIGLLGITAAAIACVILYNTTVSKLEQDKNRIGILQALGVTKEQFSNHYLKLGVLTGVISLIITHITLFLVLFLTSIGLTEGLTMSFLDYLTHIFANRLWLYPWYIHIFLCILYLAITVLIYYLPNKKVTALYPVENIRSLGR